MRLWLVFNSIYLHIFLLRKSNIQIITAAWQFGDESRPFIPPAPCTVIGIIRCAPFKTSHRLCARLASHSNMRFPKCPPCGALDPRCIETRRSVDNGVERSSKPALELDPRYPTWRSFCLLQWQRSNATRWCFVVHFDSILRVLNVAGSGASGTGMLPVCVKFSDARFFKISIFSCSW